MTNHIIKFSLLIALINACWMILYVKTFGNFSFHWGEIFRIIFLIFTFSFFTYSGIKSYKNSLSDKTIGFIQGLKLGIMISIVATCIYAVLWAIISCYFIPDFADMFAEQLINYNISIGKSTETIARKTIEMNAYKINYKKPIVNILYSLSEILPIGMILSVVCAFILKKNKGFSQ